MTSRQRWRNWPVSERTEARSWRATWAHKAPGNGAGVQCERAQQQKSSESSVNHAAWHPDRRRLHRRPLAPAMANCGCGHPIVTGCTAASSAVGFLLGGRQLGLEPPAPQRRGRGVDEHRQGHGVGVRARPRCGANEHEPSSA